MPGCRNCGGSIRRRGTNIGGAKFPIVGWPRKYTAPVSSRKSEFTSTWVNGFDAQPLWWYYQYSQDKTFLREKGYPVIKACAEFYENFVQLAPDGKYDMPPTAVWDLAFMVPDAKNSTIDLAFAKMLLRTAVAASRVLGVDEDRRANWEHVAANLSGYATTVIDCPKVQSQPEFLPCLGHDDPRSHPGNAQFLPLLGQPDRFPRSALFGCGANTLQLRLLSQPARLPRQVGEAQGQR